MLHCSWGIQWNVLEFIFFPPYNLAFFCHCDLKKIYPKSLLCVQPLNFTHFHVIINLQQENKNWIAVTWENPNPCTRTPNVKSCCLHMKQHKLMRKFQLFSQNFLWRHFISVFFQVQLDFSPILPQDIKIIFVFV